MVKYEEENIENEKWRVENDKDEAVENKEEEEFEEEYDEDDFEMIKDIVEDQIKNNSAITAQPIIWREKMLKLSKLKNL